MKITEISQEEYQRIEAAEKQCKDKRNSKKLCILMSRISGNTIAETAKHMMCSESKVKRVTAEYLNHGLEELMKNKYKANNRSLSEEEENEILSRFEKMAEAGQVVTAQEIKKAFDERRGKDTGRGYIYMLLKRHGWRRIMPRSKHPKKASAEAIEASKKLRQHRTKHRQRTAESVLV